MQRVPPIIAVAAVPKRDEEDEAARSDDAKDDFGDNADPDDEATERT